MIPPVLASKSVRSDDHGQSSPRSFGFVFAAFFTVIALAPLAKHGQIRSWALPIAGAIFLCAILAPQFLALPNKFWLRFGLFLHRITQPIVMAVLFFVVITPFGFLIRWFKGDSLRRSWEPNSESYWINRKTPTAESMKHLF